MAAAAKGIPVRTSFPPNQTLYITNLPSSKIQKDDLRRELYTLCSTYGPVLDVVALKTMKMRGQAHVVYRDIQTATQAMRALQGFEFLGREMVSWHAVLQTVLVELTLSSKFNMQSQSQIP
jgi:U2 small nuclear ribonucleoprotein B''